MNSMNENTYDYDLRFAVLPSDIIFNSCGPGMSGPVGWDDKNVQIRKTMGERYIKALNEKNGFYDKLEQSIIEHGIRNPIIIHAGWAPNRKWQLLPIEMQQDKQKILTCPGLGGSRLYFAQRMGMDIPCLINDYIGRFDDCEILKTIDDVRNTFQDKPKTIRFTEHGVVAGEVPQIHLEDMK